MNVTLVAAVRAIILVISLVWRVERHDGVFVMVMEVGGWVGGFFFHSLAVGGLRRQPTVTVVGVY